MRRSARAWQSPSAGDAASYDDAAAARRLIPRRRATPRRASDMAVPRKVGLQIVMSSKVQALFDQCRQVSMPEKKSSVR